MPTETNVSGLDTAMLNIETLANSGDPRHLPYTITEEGVVIDACEQRLTTRFTSAAQDAYIVACANAAPALVEEVERLRAEVAELAELRTEVANVVRLNDANDDPSEYDEALEGLFDKFRAPEDRASA